jgi:hypothetical protein
LGTGTKWRKEACAKSGHAVGIYSGAQREVEDWRFPAMPVTTQAMVQLSDRAFLRIIFSPSATRII